MADIIAAMAANNAAWIDMAVSALGIGGEFTPVLWQNRNNMPPIFPNADTLGGTKDEQIAAIEQLVAARAGRVMAVKDSWAQLDLTVLGFEVLFTAQWLHRKAQPIIVPEGPLRVRSITTGDDLRAFALACNGPDIPVEVYSPTLLENPDVRWLVGEMDGRILAGATAVRAHGLNGINNVFGDSDQQKTQMIAAAVNAFPDLPACGYEADDGIKPYLPLGFEVAGDLRVWLRTGAG